MFVFNETGRYGKRHHLLSHSMKGREHWLIIILTSVFSFVGSYGMGEEALVFYPILVPLFLAAGYDLMSLRQLFLGEHLLVQSRHFPTRFLLLS
ncbi:MAG: hypothetical protein R2765_10745 [Ferruginibacter sp.]